MTGLALLTALTAACSATTDSEPASSDESEIIGGVTTTDPAFDAVGVLGFELPGEDGSPAMFQSLCTATLISPTVALTAKHCALMPGDPRSLFDESAIIPIYFALGPTPHQSQTAKVRIASFTTMNLGKEGFNDGLEAGLASDVALVTLAEPIASVAPLRVASSPLRTKDVGSVLTLVGYGNSDDYLATGNPLASGERRVASVPLRATEGTGLRTIYPTLDDYFTSLKNAYGYPDSARWARASEYWRPLVKDYEVIAAGGKYDASACFGDSGGPVLRREAGEWVIRAIVSGNVDSSGECAGPNVYANLGSEVQALLAQKDDPCLGIPTKGRCSSNTLVQCKDEGGVRKPELIDCASSGGTCGLDANGHAACGAPPIEHPPRTCNALTAPEGTPVQPVEIAADAPLPEGGRLLDGDYELEKDERYLGAGATVAPIEGEELTARLRVRKNKIDVVASNGKPPGMPVDREIDAMRGDGSTIGARFVNRGKGWIELQTTCPWTISNSRILFYTVTAEHLVLFKYPKKGRVEVGTYRRVSGS